MVNKLMKIVSFIFLLIVLTLNINMVLAFEFDNVKTYERDTREALFYNSFLGVKTSEIGMARLNTPLNVKVGPGYQKVAEFDIWAYKDYEMPFKEFEFLDLNKGGKEIIRDYDLRQKTYEKVLVDDYKRTCIEVLNKLNRSSSTVCERNKVGSHLEVREVWKEIKTLNLKSGQKLTVGIFTEVQDGDHVDWIPRIYGVQVSEWASWEANLEVDLEMYFSLEESNNALAVDNSTNGLDGTYQGDLPTSITGKVDLGQDLDGTGDYISLQAVDYSAGEFSFSCWVESDVASGGVEKEILKLRGTNHFVRITQNAGNNADIFIDIGDADTGTDLDPLSYMTNWLHMVVTASEVSGEMNVYFNGSLVGNSPYAFTDISSGGNTDQNDLGAGGGGGKPFDGIMDECGFYSRELSQAEVTQLYNNSFGLRFGVAGAVVDGPPTIIFNSPPSANFTTSPQNIQLNFTAWDDINLSSVKLYINNILNQTNASGINNSVYLFNVALSEGSYTIYGSATDNNSQTSVTANRTFRIHATVPSVVIHDPKPTISYYKLGGNLTLNWTVTEEGQNLTTHIKNCTYEYNGTTTVLSNTVCTQVNQTSFTYILGVNSLRFNVTDEFDFVNSTLISWQIRLTEINQTFVNQTVEGSTQDLEALINLETGQTISATILNYNGTLFAGTTSPSGNNSLVLKSGLITPSVGADENITFQWSIILSGGEIINLTEQNQTILNIGVDNCSSFTNKILSMTMVDEETQVIIASGTTLEIALNIFSLDGSTEVVDFSDEFNNTNPMEICLSINVPIGVSYSLDSIIRYEASGYANEYYNIVDYILGNSSLTQNLTLYDLNLTDSTDFQLTFTGEDFLPVENALVSVERQYISENTFKTVELPKTDSNGQTILHLVRNDVIYNIVVMKDGEVLGNFANIVAFCEDFTIGACSIPLNAISNTSLVFNYDDEIGILFQENTQYNENTRVASFSFVSVDGTTKIVSMNIERRDVFGNRSICQNTLVSSSGSVSCQISSGVTDTSLLSIISVDGEEKIYSEIILDDTAYGQNGYAMFFIFAMATMLMFSGSKTWTLVGISVNYIVGVSLGLIVGGIAGVGSTGIFILIISVIGMWQLNKGRKQ